jgi:hypothetical protein
MGLVPSGVIVRKMLQSCEKWRVSNAMLTACMTIVEDGLELLECVHEAFHIASFHGKR